MENDEYLTVTEVAERLRVNEETVRRWVRTGRLRAVMPGGRKAGYRIAERAVQEMMRGDQKPDGSA